MTCLARARQVSTPNVFFSHAWGFKFLDVLSAMRSFVDSRENEGGPPVFFWFDCFAIDEHATQSLTQEWWSTTFKDAIRAIGHTVMMLSPWHAPVPITRAWYVPLDFPIHQDFENKELPASSRFRSSSAALRQVNWLKLVGCGRRGSDFHSLAHLAPRSVPGAKITASQ